MVARPQLPMFPYVSRISPDSDWGDNELKWRDSMAKRILRLEQFVNEIDSHWADVTKYLDLWQKTHGWATLDRKQIILGFLSYMKGVK